MSHDRPSHIHFSTPSRCPFAPRHLSYVAEFADIASEYSIGYKPRKAQLINLAGLIKVLESLPLVAVREVCLIG